MHALYKDTQTYVPVKFLTERMKTMEIAVLSFALVLIFPIQNIFYA